ncbi:MGH1-like glycoside hydrolase domain-containing protein [Lignipirellula cremea]|uniref:Mannosyl oligosaccharide glucosidase n=1 Tax=Lignipirellula cremea TaxID=2528010 RepID=A0A518E2T3_9BACT|nr:glucosidase [Lignipirellula cremea]QDU98399.1 Mannosyl oligosaccharide glucosidase [Lignipirellula cremea]
MNDPASPSFTHPNLAEVVRLKASAERTANWKRWGPYLSERQWGTVREDYSAEGNPWTYFPHDHARSRAYRWGEDGLLGVTDRQCRLCFSLALWNGRDAILKERLFGLTGPEGNHGEDVKECYYYLDSTPTHSYMKALYKYPQAAFPYADLVAENARRGKQHREYELADTGVFDENRYFDLFAEYAKGSPNDLLIRITAVNRGPERSTLHLLPTLWFRNTWSWRCELENPTPRPELRRAGDYRIEADHATLGRFELHAAPLPGRQPPVMVFTENETNFARIDNTSRITPHPKDAFHTYLVDGDSSRVNPDQRGTKAALLYQADLAPGESLTFDLRLTLAEEAPSGERFGAPFEQIFTQRRQEADEFYKAVTPAELDPPRQNISRQAYAGLLWSKQFYHYSVKDWLDGDEGQPDPPESRKYGRNRDWRHLYNRDVISMPDKWEYPWYAAWDLAFHMIPFAEVDPDFAKEQLLLLLREWYMHPSGQIPAYEFAFSDVNPPVHAWACWRVYKISAPPGQRDRLFLERVFHKLLLNFTWWVNRKDLDGKHIFAGGFLGLDNIGVFDRSKPLPMGGSLEQADGTAWMAFFCGTMLSMALELARENPAYEDVASKFFEHFIAIADAINNLGGGGLWDEEDGFYYDRVHVDDSETPVKLRSLVGLVPLFAVEILAEEGIEKLPGFQRRMNWFLENRPDLARMISCAEVSNDEAGRSYRHRLLAIPSKERLERMLAYLLDENEFLSPYGIRSLSRAYAEQPYEFRCSGQSFQVKYDPGESTTGMFGGNSNWRGPIWFPMNFLIIEALERYHHFYDGSVQVECPTGSGVKKNLQEIADDLSARLAALFLPDENHRRPSHGDETRYADDPHWRDLVLFYEYFHGDNGRGLGASHQTGWTALASRLLDGSLPLRTPW